MHAVRGWSREEIDAAIVEYLARGEQTTDYEAWAQLFTDDAVYVEHSMGVFVGREAISRWIVSCMAEYAAVTNWTEWYAIGGTRVVIYAWNNFPAPTPSSAVRQFPSVSVLRYAGDGMFVRQDDFYDGIQSERLASEWAADGGNHQMPRDFSIRGIDAFQPTLPDEPHEPDEISAALATHLLREAEGAESGDWRAWADSFSDDAVLRSDADTRLEGRGTILTWAESRDTRATAAPRALWHLTDGNRVVTRISYSFDEAPGAHLASYDRMVVLHYAGDGRWSYREDVFNRHEEVRATELTRR
jgi:hypothetical protein